MVEKIDNNQQNDNFLQGKILIVGLGTTGLSCARFLKNKGADVAITDSRLTPPGLDKLQKDMPDVALFVGGFDEEAFERADYLIVSPGVSLREPLIIEARSRGVEILGDIEIFARFVNAPVVAITGSNGKSTVTTLVAQMARHCGLSIAMGGNIGIPVLDLLAEDVELYVLELSSFQLETTESLEAAAGVILNISEDHMDRYRNLADYTAAKTRIYHGNGTLVVNRDDKRVMATLSMVEHGRKVVRFGLDMPSTGDFGICEVNQQRWLCRGTELLLEESTLRIKGKHNTANALAALALGEIMAFPMSSMLETLKNFAGLEHRCQWIRERHKVNWFNDSKATNVGASLAAIAGVPANKLILIAGGQGKGQDFTPLTDIVKQRCRAVIVIGEDAELLISVFADSVVVHKVKSMRDAVAKADELALAGDAVLLSPACASFDMFSGFVERGDTFMREVEALAE